MGHDEPVCVVATNELIGEPYAVGPLSRASREARRGVEFVAFVDDGDVELQGDEQGGQGE